MPGIKGIDVLEEFASLYPDKLRILITAYSDIDVITDAINRAKIYHYITKPIDDNNFKIIIQNALNLIEERKKNYMLDEDLSITKDRYKSIIENSHEIILEFDSHFKIQYANPMAEKIMQKRLSDIFEKTPNEAGFSEDFCSKIEERLLLVKSKALIHNEELNYLDKDWDVLVIPEFDKNKNINKFLVFIRDITNIKRYEYEKQIKEKMILKAQRLTSLGTLSSAIAHEIKQPLQLVKVLTDTIILRIKKQSNRSEEDEKNLNDLYELLTGVNTINTIINSMKTIINTNKTDIVINKFDVSTLIEKIINMYDQRMSNHSITFIKNCNAHAVFVNCSDTLIQQLIGNILNNAIEALDEVENTNKKIVFTTTILNNKLIIDIEDNGPGINAEIRNTLFNPLVTTKIKGDSMGMGLHIVQTIVSSINGSIEIIDNCIQGSHFRITIPVE